MDCSSPNTEPQIPCSVQRRPGQTLSGQVFVRLPTDEHPSLWRALPSASTGRSATSIESCGATAKRGTIVAMATEALRTVKDRLSEYIDRVEHHHERIIVTRNGHAAAVIISTEDLESLEETLAVLTDPQAMEGLRTGDAAVAQGDVVRGVDAVRALRPKLAK